MSSFVRPFILVLSLLLGGRTSFAQYHVQSSKLVAFDRQHQDNFGTDVVLMDSIALISQKPSKTLCIGLAQAGL
ncbi:MAG: hypothetical protein AAGB22_10790 [Bacteroidota bacterium]